MAAADYYEVLDPRFARLFNGSAQVEKLYELFKVISSSGDDDGLIDKSEFQQALGLKRNLFVDRMFELFDANGDKNINFTEFVAGLSVFTKRAKGEEKARFSFPDVRL